MHADRPALTRDEILARLRDLLPQLRARYEVTALSLFGSRARGTADPESDVDILVEFARAPSLFRFVELEDELSNNLGLKVDLVMRSALRPAIGRRALAEALPI